MNDNLQAIMDSALRDRRLLSHPFYRRWEAGQLTHAELARYAEQYRFFEEMLPSFLEGLSADLPDGPARDAVQDNLSDETTPPTHLELFERFARSYGASSAPISAAMRTLVDSYAQIREQGPCAALAGLWAYESQGAEVADSKADALLRHYGAGPEAVVFWDVHGSVEGDHARWTFEALETLDPDVDEVEEAVRLIGDAWWAFLDERETVGSYEHATVDHRT
jgi:pyrroloquinoline-quinone synthase